MALMPFPFANPRHAMEWGELMPQWLYDQNVRQVVMQVYREQDVNYPDRPPRPLPLQCAVGPAVPRAWCSLVAAWAVWAVAPTFARCLSAPTNEDLMFQFSSTTCQVLATSVVVLILSALTYHDFVCAKYALIPMLQVTNGFSVLGVRVGWRSFLLLTTGFSFFAKADLITSGLFLAAAQEAAGNLEGVGGHAACVWEVAWPLLDELGLSFVRCVSLTWHAMLLQPLMGALLATPAQAWLHILEALFGGPGRRLWERIRDRLEWPPSGKHAGYDTKEYKVSYQEAEVVNSLDFLRGSYGAGHFYPTLFTRGAFSDHGTSLFFLADTGRMTFPTALRGEYSRINVNNYVQAGDLGPAYGILKRQLEFTIFKVLFIGVVQGMVQTMLNLDLMTTALFLSGRIPMFARVTITVTLVNFLKSFVECALVWKWARSQDADSHVAFQEDWRRQLNRRRKLLFFCLCLHLALLMFVAFKFIKILVAVATESCENGVVQAYPFDDCYSVPLSCRARQNP